MATGLITDPMTLQEALYSSAIKPGHYIYLREGTYTGEFISTLLGSSSKNITIQPYENETVIIDGSFSMSAGYVKLKKLHIKNSSFTVRTTLFEGSTPEDLDTTPLIRNNYSNFVYEDCILENAGNGFYKGSTATNVVIDGCVIFHVGWVAPDRPHGHGIYCTGQNTTVKNCICFSNFEFGIKVYDEGGIDRPIHNCTIENNIAFNNSVVGGSVRTRGDIMFGHASDIEITGATMKGNCTFQTAANMGTDDYGGNTNHIGYVSTFTNAILQDNYFPNRLKKVATNTYAIDTGNVLEPEETNKTVIIPVRNKLHVAIYNWEGLDSVDVDVSSLLDVGDGYNLINVQDYFVDIATGTAGATQIITVDMRAISHTVAAPQGIDAPPTTFPTFGCFVVEKT